MVKINGENIPADGKNLKEYLLDNNYQLTRIAIEMNGIIVPKATYEDVILKDGDILEVVSFVGGG